MPKTQEPEAVQVLTLADEIATDVRRQEIMLRGLDICCRALTAVNESDDNPVTDVTTEEVATAVQFVAVIIDDCHERNRMIGERAAAMYQLHRVTGGVK